MSDPTPTNLAAWKTLARLASQNASQRIETLLSDEARNANLRVETCSLSLDASKQRIDQTVLNSLFDLARESTLETQRDALLRGDKVNRSEDRPALHTALRAADEPSHPMAATVSATLTRLESLVTRLQNGDWQGLNGHSIRDVVHIGIGGSHLGPELAVDALPNTGRFNLHFVANIDGLALHEVLRQCDPERTLFIVVSKSFSTIETLTNAETARSWFVERTGRADAVAQHFIAISANTEASAAFGIPAANVYPMWDWVGGRYSLWSAVGLPIALSGGWQAFQGLLDGARDMDEHFASAPLERNLPVLLALVGIWNYNFLGTNNHAVLAYDERLALLPDYLQQLEMESNGKSVQQDGTPVASHTMPILWGGVGTNGQHAYHQLLHQGTRSYSADFILSTQSHHDYSHHQRWLHANALAQAQAMMAGEETLQPERRVPGNHPSSSIILHPLTPYSMGALLAAYEHKVFCQGVIWNINSFDQWGVELGKKLAKPIFEQLDSAQAPMQDASTRYLLNRLHQPNA